MHIRISYNKTLAKANKVKLKTFETYAKGKLAYYYPDALVTFWQCIPFTGMTKETECDAYPELDLVGGTQEIYNHISILLWMNYDIEKPCRPSEAPTGKQLKAYKHAGKCATVLLPSKPKTKTKNKGAVLVRRKTHDMVTVLKRQALFML